MYSVINLLSAAFKLTFTIRSDYSLQLGLEESALRFPGLVCTCKMPSAHPLKTYCNLQIRIFVVFSTQRHLGNSPVQLRFEIRDIS